MCFQHPELECIYINEGRVEKSEIKMSYEVSHAYNKYKINYFYLESQYGGRGKIALFKLKLLYISIPNGNR